MALTVLPDGTTAPLDVGGSVIGALGSGWVAQSFAPSNGPDTVYRFHFIGPDGKTARTVDVADLKGPHHGSPGDGQAKVSPLAVRDGRLYLLRSRPTLPLPEDGQTLSDFTLQQYGADGTLLREDPVAF